MVVGDSIESAKKAIHEQTIIKLKITVTGCESAIGRPNYLSLLMQPNC